MPEIERKQFPLIDIKAAGDGAGSFTGYGSVFGNTDSQGDIVVPGAFTATLPQFLTNGFIADSHEWDEPIAMPTMAREDNRGLYIEADFHSTDGAQEARTIMAERAAKGLLVGLSIGYETKQFEMIAADAAVAQGMAKEGDRENWIGGYRLLKAIDLYEVSIVTVPSNRAANVTAIKSPERMTFSEHVDFAEGLVSGLKAFADRVRSRTDIRQKEGRVLSEANRARLMSHIESLTGIVGDLKDMHAATDPQATGKAALKLTAEYQRTRSMLREMGIAG